MITGDKQETAINIAISCKLIRHPDSLLICNAESPEAAAQRIADLTAQIRKMRGEPEKAQLAQHPAPRKKGFFARFAHLNPFEDEEANPKHQQNLHLTVAKVGESPCCCCKAADVFQGSGTKVALMCALHTLHLSLQLT